MAALANVDVLIYVDVISNKQSIVRYARRHSQ